MLEEFFVDYENKSLEWKSWVVTFIGFICKIGTLNKVVRNMSASRANRTCVLTRFVFVFFQVK